MRTGENWTREEVEAVMAYYLVVPFGQIDQRNPDVIRIAKLLGRTPGAVSYKLTNLASCDPEIVRSGRKGSTNISKIDREVFEAYRLNPKTALEHVEEEFWKSDDPQSKDHALSEPVNLRVGKSILRETKVRKGQDFFRRVVRRNFDSSCAITGLQRNELLIASHIVPWAADESRRCDPSNGILLNALHDRAFDQGFITFSDNLSVRVSSFIKTEEENAFVRDALLSLDGRKILGTPRTTPICLSALGYHRAEIFLE